MKKRYARTRGYRIIAWRNNSHSYKFEIRDRLYGGRGPVWELEAEGTVKWDGCIDWWSFDDNAIHGCSTSDVTEFCDALKMAYRLCGEELAKQSPDQWPDVKV